jgi:hypothetical protein
MEVSNMDTFVRALQSIRLLVGVSIMCAFAITPYSVWSQNAGTGATSEDNQSLHRTHTLSLPGLQEAYCRRSDSRKNGIAFEQCQRVRSILAIMSAEPRAAWADSMEDFLKKWVKSLEHGFTLKSVECRLSWCFVEAGSVVGAGTVPGH